MVLEEARSQPRSRKLSQSDAGGSRDKTTARKPVVRRRKTLADEATRVRGPRGEHTQQQGEIKRTQRAKPTAGKTRAKPTASEKSNEDLETDGKQSDTVKESIAKSTAETTPKSEPKAKTKPKAEPTAETKAKAKADAKAKSTPKPFRVDRTGGDWEVSNRVGSWRQNEERKMMEADVRGVSQATTAAVALQNTMAVGSTPAPRLQRRSSRNLRRKR